MGICSLLETILQFFKEFLPNVIDGKIGENYSDIVEHSLEKVILYMGHSLHCRIQQMRIKEIKNMSTGNDEDDDYYVFDLDGDSDDEKGHMVCDKCGKIVKSNYHFQQHQNSKACTNRSLNMSVGERALRLLRLSLDNDEIVVHDRDSNLDYLANELDTCWSDLFFKKGWAKRKAHGKTKGNTYMTDEHKEMITIFFMEGEEDKGKKKSSALMVEAMVSHFENEGNENDHPHKTHYVPFVSEVTVVISQLSTGENKSVTSMVT